MQTRTEYAAYVENNDFIVENGESIGYVYSIIEDTADFITFDVVDEDGEHFNFRRAPFDEVQIVETFEDEDDESVEKVWTGTEWESGVDTD